jgi:hypothetical protein
MASHFADRSSSQIVRSMGLTDEKAHQATEQSSRNIDAIVHSSRAYADALQSISRELSSFCRERLDRREIGLAVRPPQGVAIVLTEDPGTLPNWVAAVGSMEAALTHKFSEKVAELRDMDPLVDWSEVDRGQTEIRRIVTFSSEAT